MNKLATIEKIHSIQPHPNPEVEKLEVGKIKEWPVVIPKGQYKDEELIVFIQIDSIVPETNPYFEFMRRQKFRVWNARFKGAPSQGLVCPLSIINNQTVDAIGRMTHRFGADILQEGEDVTELLGIIKYEKPLDATICGDAKCGFPTHLVSITDEDNLLNNPEVLNEIRGERCYITLKADGSSMTVYHNEGQVGVCSRKWEQKEGTGLWKIAEFYDLSNKLKSFGKSIAIQGEACGGKIQGNPLGLNTPSMFVFNVKDISTGKWYGWEEIKELCKTLGINPVRIICEDFIFDETWTIPHLQAIANGATYLTDKGEIRKGEGIVIRPMIPKYSPTLSKSLSVKILNQEYK